MTVLLIIFGTLLAVFLASVLYIKLNPQFGAAISSEDKKQYARSKHWNGKIFENTSETVMDVSLKTLPKIIKLNLEVRKVKKPSRDLEMVPFDAEKWSQITEEDEPQFIWFGHSVLLMKLVGKTILIDPMFGPDASPIAPFPTRRFSKNTLQIIDQLPEIDLCLLTHDHYDHLDYKSIKKLIPKVKMWKTVLGVGRHLRKWGISSPLIEEFDWWEKTALDSIEITCTPNRHFGGRGPTDRAESFWCGWVFKTKEHSIYWSGDGGYDTHYKEVGDKLGPFQWTFMECGQYGQYWHPIHNYPQEAAQASEDAQSKYVVPVHWGGFSLAPHHWKEPIEEFMEHSQDKSYTVSTPKPGEMFGGAYVPITRWWDQYESEEEYKKVIQTLVVDEN